MKYSEGAPFIKINLPYNICCTTYRFFSHMPSRHAQHRFFLYLLVDLLKPVKDSRLRFVKCLLRFL